MNGSTSTDSSSNPFEGIGLDDDLLKALNGFGGGSASAGHVEGHHGPESGAGSGSSQHPPPQSAANFDGMGFDLNTGELNFDVSCHKDF